MSRVVLSNQGAVVAEAFVFCNTFKVREGKRDEYAALLERMVPAIEEVEPDMMQYGAFFNEETSEATALQVHRTVENFAFHMSAMSQFIEASRHLIDFSDMSITIYGTPTEPILERMRQMAGAGVKVSISRPVAGFNRYD